MERRGGEGGEEVRSSLCNVVCSALSSLAIILLVRDV